MTEADNARSTTQPGWARRSGREPDGRRS
jgi:hypothetical protein